MYYIYHTHHGLKPTGIKRYQKKKTQLARVDAGWCRLMPVDAWRPKAHVDATAGSKDPTLLGLHAWSSGHGTHQCDVVAAGAGHVQRRREGHVHLLTHAKPGDICWVSLWWFHIFFFVGGLFIRNKHGDTWCVSWCDSCNVVGFMYVHIYI